MDCRTCRQPFTVGEDEVGFLARISPKFGEKTFAIPSPVDCPDCRLRLRTMHRNEQYLYKRPSAFSSQPLITLYTPDTPWGAAYKVVSNEEWWSDSWDGLDFGRDFDFNRPFFEQLHELDLQVPRVNLMQVDNENSPYTTGTGYCKNCYLINSSENCEDCYYGKLIQSSRDVMDSSYAYDSELLYQCFYVKKCYNCVFVSYSQNSNDCFFSENLSNCRNCFLCTDLSGKEYYVRNKPVSKEEFAKIVSETLGSHKKFEEARRALAQMRKNRTYKYANIINCENSTGDFLTNCKKCIDSYDVNDSEDCKYVTVGVNVKDIYDCSNMYLKPELNYQVLGTIGTYNVIFSLYIFHSQNVMYSQSCFYSKNLFGCIGLRNKQYCIFNKQYTKEQYEELVPKIIEHMQKPVLGKYAPEWGQFFPYWMSPFGYNETVAQEYLPLTRERATELGFNWRDSEDKNAAAAATPKTPYAIPDTIQEVGDDVLAQLLTCESCGRNYKIIAQELTRLRNMKLPVPHKCPDCRHSERMKLRNPRKLFDRSCSQCGLQIQSTFNSADERKILCEKCYQNAVY